MESRAKTRPKRSALQGDGRMKQSGLDAYFSADVETDGPIPGPFSILSFALVYAGSYDGSCFKRPKDYGCSFYRELRPISDTFDPEALRVNGLDRNRLCLEGDSPESSMTAASQWVRETAESGNRYSLPTH